MTIKGVPNNSLNLYMKIIENKLREDIFKDKGLEVGAEIGTYKGELAVKLCEMGLKLYCIDPYNVGRPQKRNDFLYKYVTDILQPYNCKVIRKTSMEALEDFEDESLDFVFIDGNHDFKHVAEDIFEWAKKVRKGGIIAGHDYYNATPQDGFLCQVSHVVDAYVKTFFIDELYLIGQSKTSGNPNDVYHSWYFIK